MTFLLLGHHLTGVRLNKENYFSLSLYIYQKRKPTVAITEWFRCFTVAQGFTTS